MIYKSDVQVREAGDDDATRWNNYISTNKDGLAYHYFSWKQAIENSYGFACPYFFTEKNGQILGVLPTVHLHAPLAKGQLVSLPYCDAGGILAENNEIAALLFDYACQYARKAKISKIEIRYPNPMVNSVGARQEQIIANRLAADAQTSPKVRMLLELPGNSQMLLASFKSKVRSQINKPSRDGLFAKLGGPELLDFFYPLFAENMRDLGSPVHSKNWLEKVLTYYKERAKCGVVFMPDNTPAAGGIILCHKTVVSVPWASSLQRLNRFNPNMMLYWTFLEFAVDNGYRFFDFGRSTPEEGTYKFKAQWGAQPQPLFWEQWKIGKNGVCRDDFQIISNPHNPGRKIAEKIIQKIPLPAATFLGDKLRKYISL